MDYFGFGYSIFNNRIFYKQNSNNYSFGVFNSFDGSGIELGFRFGGVHLNLPIFLFKNELDLDEVDEKGFISSALEFCFMGILSAGVNYIMKFILTKIFKFKKKGIKRIINESIIAEKRQNIMKLRDEYYKSLEILTKTAEKYHQIELEKKQKGLIIHLALYGNFERLAKHKKDFDYIANQFNKSTGKTKEEFNLAMKIKEYKIPDECENIENEILDVTLPVRNKISCTSLNCFSSILFSEKTKTQIFGFYNPIFKSDDIPSILIM